MIFKEDKSGRALQDRVKRGISGSRIKYDINICNPGQNYKSLK